MSLVRILVAPGGRPAPATRAWPFWNLFLGLGLAILSIFLRLFYWKRLPPQSDTTRDWAKRLAEIVPEAHVFVAEDADTAAREIVDAWSRCLGWRRAGRRHDRGRAHHPLGGRRNTWQHCASE
jgi:hypothetical protein